jgi:putative endonuclease
MREEKDYCTYIMMNKRNTVIYVGVSGSLVARVYQHKRGEIDGFTKKYNVKKLVHFEVTDNAYDAICREKQLKSWSRKKKLELIKKENPHYEDLAKDWYKEEFEDE